MLGGTVLKTVDSADKQMMRKLLFILILLLPFQIFANIFSQPRHIYVLPTEYFDVMFPKGAEETAYFVASNADRYFDEAAGIFSLDYRFRLPLVISLDSDSMKFSYSPSPYNRILVFNSPENSDFSTSDSFSEGLRQVIYKAVASNVKNKFWQNFHKIIKQDAWQPVTLLNIPSAFMDGAVDALSIEEGKGREAMSDDFSLQVLIQAKSEGLIPRWKDALGSNDVELNSLSEIIQRGFVCYMISRWGMEKFSEFWKESGSINFFRMTPGIFKKVYGLKLSDVWKDFVDTIPVKTSSEKGMILLREKGEGLFSGMISGEKGIYYINSSKGSVNLLKNDGKQKKLFSAVSAKNLSVSEDEKYLAVSYSGSKRNEELRADCVQIYDMKKKLFMKGFYKLRNGTFVKTSPDSCGVAGFYCREFKTSLKIYEFDNEILQEVLFTKDLPEGIQTEAVIPWNTGKLFAVYQKDRKTVLQLVDYFFNTDEYFVLPVQGKNFKKARINGKNGLCFTYSSEGCPSSGYISFDESGKIKSVMLGNENIYGGIYDSVIKGDKLFYSSHLAREQLLKEIPVELIDYKAFNIEKPDEESEKAMHSDYSDAPRIITWKHDKYLGKYRLKSYQPVPYMFKGTWFPLFPISSIDFKETTMAPGLGATYYTSADPAETVNCAFSFCYGFLDYSDRDNLKFNEDYTAAAYFSTTVLPCTLSLTGLLKFTEDGEYDFNVFLGMDWKVDLGWPNQNLVFGLKERWNCSTTYIDYETQKTVTENNWPGIGSCGNTFTTFISLDYSNYRQWGKSAFEQLGLEFGTALTALYDPAKDKKENDSPYDTTQLTLGFDFGFKIPCILPVFGVENWVFSCPLTVYTQWYQMNGTSSESYAEILLAGYEFQKALPFTALYVQRFGLKFGYDISTVYNEYTSEDADLRYIKNYFEVLKDSEVDDYLYLSFNVDFSPSIGRFAHDTKLSGGVRFQVNPEMTDWKVKALFNMNL